MSSFGLCVSPFSICGMILFFIIVILWGQRENQVIFVTHSNFLEKYFNLNIEECKMARDFTRKKEFPKCVQSCGL